MSENNEPKLAKCPNC